MKAKSFLLLVMFFVFGNILIAQNVSEDSLRSIVTSELNKYNELRAQIDRLASVATKRLEVQKQYNAGNMSALMQSFEVEEKQLIDIMKNQSLEAASDKLVEMKMIYKDIPSVQDRILYDKALIDFNNKYYESAQVALEDFIKYYPNSIKYNAGISLLEKIYIATNQDIKLIALDSTITTAKTNEQIYALGQAYYNLGQYDNSYESFMSITGDKTLGLRSKAMLALIVVSSVSPDAALEQFMKIKDDYSPEAPYYDFILLCIARLYAELGNLDEALTYYSQYSQVNANTSASEIKYEMAIALKNSGKFGQAETLLNQILNDPKATEFYTSSVYMIVYMKSIQGDEEGARNVVDNSEKLNDNFLQLINEKHHAIYRLRDLRDQFISSNSKETNLAIVNEMSVLEQQISDIDLQLTNQSYGINPVELKKIQNIEDKYITYQNLLTQEVLKIKQLVNKPNVDETALIDKHIADLDSTYVKAFAYNLIANLPEVSATKYENAQLISREIWEERKALLNWKQVGDQAKKSGNTALADKAYATYNSLAEDIANLELAANHFFGNYNTNPEKEQAIRSTLQDIMNTRDSLIVIREDVSKNFNRKLAGKLLRDAKTRIGQFDEIFKVYGQQFESLNQQVNEMNKQFEYTLLELSYIKTLNNDKLLQKESERTDQQDQGTGSR